LLVVTLLPSWITWLPEGHPATVMSVWSLPGAPNPPIASWKFQGFCCYARPFFFVGTIPICWQFYKGSQFMGYSNT
jgi:hypothetical protein